MDKECEGKERRAPAEICLKHARELGKLSTSYKSLIRQNRRLFEMARVNEAATTELKGIINNGLVKEIKDLCEQTKNQFNAIDERIQELKAEHNKTIKKVDAIQAEEDKGPTGFLRRSWSVFIGKCKNNEWWFWPVILIFLAWAIGKIMMFGERAEWMGRVIKTIFGI
jgi:hypothetical protein